MRRRARVGFAERTSEHEAWRLSVATTSRDRQLLERHLDADLINALADLPPQLRTAVVLCDVDGLTYEEIARTCGIRRSAVRSRIHRGRRRLLVALEASQVGWRLQAPTGGRDTAEEGWP